MPEANPYSQFGDTEEDPFAQLAEIQTEDTAPVSEDPYAQFAGEQGTPAEDISTLPDWNSIKSHPSFKEYDTEQRVELRDNFLSSKGVRPESKTGIEFYDATKADMEDHRGFLSNAWAGLKTGVDTTQGLAFGLGALGADAVGLDGARDSLIEGYKRNMEEAQQNGVRINDIADIHGFGDFTDWFASSLGQLTPTMASMLATGGVSGVLAKVVGERAAKRFIAKAVKDGVSESEKKILMRTMAKRVKKSVEKAQAAGTFAGAMGMETGEIYGDVASDGHTGYEAIGKSLAGGALAGALDALPVVGLAKRFGFAGELKGKIAEFLQKGGMLKRVGKGAAAMSVFEGTTEGLQTAIAEFTKSWITGKDLPEDLAHQMLNAAAMGATAGVFGGIGGVRKPAQTTDNPPDDVDPPSQDAPPESAGTQEDQSLLDQLNQATGEPDVNLPEGDLGHAEQPETRIVNGQAVPQDQADAAAMEVLDQEQANQSDIQQQQVPGPKTSAEADQAAPKVPESDETLAAQLDAFVDGRKPSVLIMPGETIPQIPEGAKTFDLGDSGVLIYNDNKALSHALNPETLGLALGYGTGAKPKEPTGAVVSKDAQGRIVGEQVTDSTKDKIHGAVLLAAHKLAGEGGTVEQQSIEQVLQNRIDSNTGLYSSDTGINGSQPSLDGSATTPEMNMGVDTATRKGGQGDAGSEVDAKRGDGRKAKERRPVQPDLKAVKPDISPPTISKTTTQDDIAASISEAASDLDSSATSDAAPEVRDASLPEKVYSEKADPVTDINGGMTGWKYIKHTNVQGVETGAITVVSADGKSAVDFNGKDKMRNQVNAQSYAMDNPYSIKQSKPGELVSKPLVEANKILSYYEKHIQNTEKGALVPDEKFEVGIISDEQRKDTARFLNRDSVPEKLRMSGRTLKHVDEQRPKVARQIVENLQSLFIDKAEVLPNHKDVGNKVLFVHRSSENKSYAASVEVEIEIEEHDGYLDIVSVMIMPERTLRKAREIKKNWPEGQQLSNKSDNSPHPVTSKEVHAEADLSDVRPTSNSPTIAQSNNSAKSEEDHIPEAGKKVEESTSSTATVAESESEAALHKQDQPVASNQKIDELTAEYKRLRDIAGWIHRGQVSAKDGLEEANNGLDLPRYKSGRKKGKVKGGFTSENALDKEVFRLGGEIRSLKGGEPIRKGINLYSRANKSEWPEDFPNATIHTSSTKLYGHPDYKAAKAGDVDAAKKLVKDLIKPAKIREMLKKHPDAIVVFPHAEEKAGRNTIPAAMATAFKDAGFELDSEVVQSNRAGRTEKDSALRLAVRPEFDGTIEQGREYIILDDALGAGGTIAELRYFVESNGGTVVDTSTLISGIFGAKVSIRDTTITALEKKHGRKETEVLLYEFNTAGRIEALTEKEGRFILRQPSLNTLRDKILEAAQEAGISPDEWGVHRSLLSKLSESQQAAPSGGLSRSEAETELRQDKRLGKMIDSGKLKVILTKYGLPLDVILSSGGDTLSGTYSPATGIAYLVAGNNSAETIKAVAWHEIVHSAMDQAGSAKDFLGKKQHEKLMKRLGVIYKMASKSSGTANEFFTEAFDRIPAKTPTSAQLDELAGYAVERYASAPQTVPQSIARWVKDFIAAIKAAIFRHTGVLIGKLKPQDLLAIAKAYASFEARKADSEQQADSGGVSEVVFLRSVVAGDKSTGRMTKEEVQSIADEFMDSYNGNMPLRVVVGQTQEDIYGAKGSVENAGIIKGAYHPASGVFTLTADNLSSVQDAISTIRHEVLGHYGLNTFSPADKRAILDKIIASRKEPSLKDIWSDIDNRYGDKTEDQRAEEVFAHIAEEQTAGLKDFFDAILSLISKAIRAIRLGKGPISKSELRRLSISIAKGIKDGSRKQQNFPESDDALFSRGKKALRPSGREYTADQAAAVEKTGRPDNSRSYKEAITKGYDKFRKTWRQGVIDQFDSFRSILNDERSWMMAHLTKSATGVIDGILNYGSPEMHQNAVRMKEGSKGLTEILEPLGAEVDDFLKWIAANRAENINKKAESALAKYKAAKSKIKSIEQEIALISSQKAEGMALGMDGAREQNKIIAMRKDEIRRLKNEAKRYKERSDVKERFLSSEDIKTLKTLNQGKMPDGQSRMKVYHSVRKGFEVLNADVVQMAVDTHLINAEEAAMWKEEGFYVPFYRAMEDDSGEHHGPRITSKLIRQTAYKKLKGADKPLDDLLTNVIMNWNHLVSASLNSQAAMSALTTAAKMGAAERVSEQARSKDAVFIRANGEQRWYEVHEPQVAAALAGLNYDGLNNHAMKAMRMFKRWLTIGVTASPEFKLRNLFRDTIQAMAVANMRKRGIKNIRQGFKATQHGNKTNINMLFGGGAFGDSGYIHGTDPDAVRRLAEKKGTLINDPANFMKHLWTAYQDFGARLENVNRAANFEQAVERGDDLLSANFQARDHLDFSRTGSWVAIRALTQVIPFLNARAQGLDKMARAGMDKNQRAQFLTVIGYYSLISIYFYMAMKDDDDYKDSEDWQRNTYHMFKMSRLGFPPVMDGDGNEIMFKLPRPFEVGAIANMAERITEQFVNDKATGEDFAESLWFTIEHTLAIDLRPQMFRPALEVYANKNSFTKRSIESMGMRFQPVTERSRPWTSETAKVASKAMNVIGDELTLSPVQIQHLVRGYFGWMGQSTLGAADMLVTRHLLDTPEKPDWRMDEYPVLKAFMENMPKRHVKQAGEFYENMKEVNQAYNAIKRYRKDHNPDAVSEVQEEHGQQLKHRKMLNRESRRIRILSKKMENVYKNRNMTGAEKESEIERINAERNKIYKRAVKRSERAFD